MPTPVSGFAYSFTRKSHFFGVAFEGKDIIFHQGGLDRGEAEIIPDSHQRKDHSFREFSENEFSIRTDPSGMSKLYVCERARIAISDPFMNCAFRQNELPLTQT